MSDAVPMVAALVDLRLGTLIGSPGDVPELVLEDLAAITPELFAVDRVSWELVFGRLQASADLRGFQDVVLVSAERVYLVLRSGRDRGVGLVGVVPRSCSIGMALVEARARLRQLEERA